LSKINYCGLTILLPVFVCFQSIRGELSQFVDEMVIPESMIK